VCSYYKKVLRGVALNNRNILLLSAYAGWQNNILDNHWFTKIKNTLSFIPKQGDIVFFWPSKTNWYMGHVWIIDSATLFSMKVLNQNMWNWDGKWIDDYVKISKLNYILPKCLWVYRKEEQKDHLKRILELEKQLKEKQDKIDKILEICKS